GLTVEIKPCIIGERSSLAECRDRAHYDLGIDSFERVITQSHLTDDARREILDHNIDLGHQLLDQIDAFRPAQIDTEAFLAPILLDEESAPLVADVVEVARPVTMRSELNLDDFGAHPRHQAGSGWSGDEVGKIKHLVTGEQMLRAVSHSGMLPTDPTLKF